MMDGTDQAHRSAPALAPGYLLVDELGFEQRVAISEQLAARLAFVDARGEVQGSWQPLLRSNELLLLASIAASGGTPEPLEWMPTLTPVPKAMGAEPPSARLASPAAASASSATVWGRPWKRAQKVS